MEQQISQIWKTIREYHASGHTTALLGIQSQLEDVVSSEELDERERIIATTMNAELHLLMIRRVEARRALSRWIRWNDPEIHVNEAALSTVEQFGPRVFGRVLTQIANLYYRHHNFEEGTRFAKRASAAFSKHDGGAEAFPLLLAQQENEIWLARLEAAQPWSRRDVLKRLEAAISSLTNAYATPDAVGLMGGRLDLVMALAGNEYALLEWNAGDLAEARRRIYRALFLLRNGRANDEVRLAHTLWTAARIEGSYSTKQFAWGVHLADQAATLFKDLDHPFRSRARVQALRGRVKAAQDPESLAKLMPELSSLEDDTKGIVDSSERQFIEAELTLTKIWIKQRTRSEDGWREWEDEAKKLVESTQSLPLRRLRGEALLQRGRVATHFAHLKSDEDALIAARRQIHEALALAQKDDRFKFEAACHLALAESYIGGDTGRARYHWSVAEGLPVARQSVYVSEWIERLRPRVDAPIVVPPMPWEKAEPEFRNLYLSHYHALCKGDRACIQQKTGIKPSTLSRYFKEWNGRDREHGARAEATTRTRQRRVKKRPE